MSTVLVTGAGSAIGRLLVDRLLASHQVIALTHRRPVDARGGRVELLPGGLERCAEHAQRIRAADTIVHLAAVTHSDEVSRYERVNFELTLRLMEATRPGQRMIFVSTVCAHPRGGAYGHSKWRAEEAIRASDLDWVIVRPAEVYGSKAGEGMDALIHVARRWRLVPDFRARDPVRYAPVACERVAHFLAEVANRFVRPRSVYTLCAHEPCTARDIAAALGRAGHRVACVPVPLGLLRAALRARLPVPFVPDQLDRLVVPKDLDLREAQRDYGFEPGDFLADLVSSVAGGARG